ncbi:hypothetical protein ARMSODRAFT_981784 [Armillaria solidipes]|uniref:F-box domain-containing protein n=1 Tax=Armillaria solidipes TaxID=1076256 RepID=A0A2H3AQH0_9AGAR|nr:hypothetical protein ARMSODRAFT_981784 [Armillaria solidipes]
MSSTLYGLPDDVVIYKFTFLSVPDILRLRLTCQRFNALTRLPIVWENAFELDILANNYPFDTDDLDIEHRTCQAYGLASRWLADSPLTPKIETIFIGSPVYGINFIPGRQHKFVLTVSVVGKRQRLLTIWDTTRQQKCSEWSSKDDVITRTAINVDAESEAGVAVSLDRQQKIVLLHLDDNGILHEIHTIDINLYAVTLTGDILALSDMRNEFKTLIFNWKTGARSYLEFDGDTDPGSCHHVVFTPSTILVGHTTYINLFKMPPILDGRTLTPIATHFFGLTEGSSVPIPAPNNPLSILIRPDDPGDDDSYSLELYSLSSFPPILTSKTPDRFINFVLGRRSTAICVRDSDDYCHKTLIAAVFPGPLNATSEVRVREILCPLSNNWTPLDYDEDLGRIAFMSAKSGLS